MTTILVNIHFIVAKVNNYIKNNKHKTGFYPNSRTNCHLQTCIPLHHPSHTQHQELTLFKPARTIRAEAERNGSAFKPVGLSGYRQEWSEAELL